MFSFLKKEKKEKKEEKKFETGGKYPNTYLIDKTDNSHTMYYDQITEIILHNNCTDDAKDEITTLLNNDNTDINFQDPNGNTCLHNAVTLKRYNWVEFLLQHNANVNIKNNVNEIPIYNTIFQAEGCFSVFKLLIDNGSDIKLLNVYNDNIMTSIIRGMRKFKHNTDLILMLEYYMDYKINKQVELILSKKRSINLYNI